ncbi:sigma factor [Micromonospora matsumotoense]|uniref:sigma factor n=1 Tax=Micromonospora matsumotoense TaxID=121616 RepID=UPI003D9139B7
MRDEQSFDEFYRSTSARTLRYGHGVVGDHGEAQDLVQEAYARAWRQRGRLAGHPAPEAWLRLVVSRLAADRFRRLRSWRTAISRAGPPPDVRQGDPAGGGEVRLVRAIRLGDVVTVLWEQGWEGTSSDRPQLDADSRRAVDALREWLR